MSKSRPSWLIATPLLVVLLIAAGWSAFWYIAQENAKQRFAEEIERAAEAGRDLGCTDESWGGYPFRLTLRCSSFNLEYDVADGRSEFTTGAFTVVALAYKPQHVIAEAFGPIAISAHSGETLQFTTADGPTRASLIWSLSGAEQISVLAENISGSLSLPDSEAADFTIASANIHLRIGELDDAGNASVETVARIDDIVGIAPPIPELENDTLEIATIQLDGTATDVPLGGTGGFSERARQWQRDGGRFEVRLFRVDSNMLNTQSTGELTLSDEGHIEGDLKTAVRGFDAFLARLSEAGVITDEQARGAEAILIVLGQAAGDPENPAIEIQTDVKMGSFYFGPFKILRLPALF